MKKKHREHDYAIQTNMGYANSMKWNGICFLKKGRGDIVLCRIKWMMGCNSIKMLRYAAIKNGAVTILQFHNLFISLGEVCRHDTSKK